MYTLKDLERFALRRYRRCSWRTGASEESKRYALRLALSRLRKRRRRSFLDTIQEGGSTYTPVAPAATSASNPIIISDDEDDDEDEAEGIDEDLIKELEAELLAPDDQSRNESAEKGGGSDNSNNDTDMPPPPDLNDGEDIDEGLIKELEAELLAPDPPVPDPAAEDIDEDLIKELEAELLAPEPPDLAPVALPPLPLPRIPKKKKPNRSKNLASYPLSMHGKFDAEKLDAEFQALVAQSRRDIGIGAGSTVPPSHPATDPGSSSAPATTAEVADDEGMGHEAGGIY
ncbi:hypothetical protein PGQ11_008882 [Apiospora arundinis]|uniref:Uncharacterized protein n=1 Tax=Apiospora arundinis TaxID=335852 RepID=A0ABR2IH24_9PEZI